MPLVPRRVPLLLLTFLGVLTIIGCASVRERIPIVGERQHIRNEGYSLLFELASKESDVDKILILKHAQAPITAEIKAIAMTFQKCRTQLEAFKKTDPSLRFQASDFPALEKKTRDAIESTTTKRLLISAGENFERELLLTQLQSLDYGSHLAGVLQAQDNIQQRRAFLVQFANECEQHHDRVMQLCSAL